MNRKTIVSLVAGAIMSAVIPVGTAQAAPRPCPSKWTTLTAASLDPRYNASYDRNGNGTECMKTIRGQGGGNTGSNYNLKDDRVPRV